MLRKPLLVILKSSSLTFYFRSPSSAVLPHSICFRLCYHNLHNNDDDSFLKKLWGRKGKKLKRILFYVFVVVAIPSSSSKYWKWKMRNVLGMFSSKRKTRRDIERALESCQYLLHITTILWCWNFAAKILKFLWFKKCDKDSLKFILISSPPLSWKR